MEIKITKGMHVHLTEFGGDMCAEVEGVYARARYEKDISLLSLFPVVISDIVKNDNGLLELILSPNGITVPSSKKLESIVSDALLYDCPATTCSLYRIGDSRMLVLTSPTKDHLIIGQPVDTYATHTYQLSQSEFAELQAGAELEDTISITDLLPSHKFRFDESSYKASGGFVRLSLDS